MAERIFRSCACSFKNQYGDSYDKKLLASSPGSLSFVQLFRMTLTTRRISPWDLKGHTCNFSVGSKVICNNRVRA